MAMPLPAILGRRSEALSFWATHSGAEVDLFRLHAGKNRSLEVKYADAPQLTPSMKSALESLDLEPLWVLYPGDRAYRLAEKVPVVPRAHLESGWPDAGRI